MSDFESRHMIEALRSGVPSRAVGTYFSSARGSFISNVENLLDAIIETGKSDPSSIQDAMEKERRTC